MEPLSNLTDPLWVLASTEWGANNASEDYDTFLYRSSGYVAVRNAQTVVLPAIFAFGVLGNVLAVGCFMSRSLRSTSCCLYMAAKCVSDTVFLGALCVMWLYRVHVELVNIQGICQLTVFLSYVSGFVSVWLALAVTYENYVRICCPGLTKIRCTRRVALTLTTVIVMFAVLFYSFALWTTSVLGEGASQPLCMSLIRYKDVLMVMTFIDTVITLVLPSLIIVPLVAASMLAIVRAYDRKTRLHDALLSKVKVTKFNNTLEAKVAKFLLSVSLTFLLLHTPAHFIRLKQLVSLYILHLEQNPTDAMLQRLFETFYYLNFCCSVVIFLASGANFRAIFLTMYCGGTGAEASCIPAGDGLSMSLKKRRHSRPSCENHAFTQDPESVYDVVVLLDLDKTPDSE